MAASLSILRDNIPLLDVRAPNEFARGSFAQAVNLPLLSDEERHQVGITYKQAGQAAAIARGHELVCGAKKRQRVEAWSTFMRENPSAQVCCWRGGLRSQTAVDWLREVGIEAGRVEGGFKALRQAVLGVLVEWPAAKRLIVLGGKTGSGKTELIHEVDWSIDLEGAAHHRGSSFGAQREPQPTQVAFENRLAVALLRAGSAVLVEDEARNIGGVVVPEPWVMAMRGAPLVVVELAFDERTSNIARDYVDEPLATGVPPEQLLQQLRSHLRRLRKRLGDQRWRTIDGALADAFRSGDHGAWIGPVLTHYYDPMYEYQIERFGDRVAFRGDRTEVVGYLAECSGAGRG